jgi:hypothetical protein
VRGCGAQRKVPSEGVEAICSSGTEIILRYLRRGGCERLVQVKKESAC